MCTNVNCVGEVDWEENFKKENEQFKTSIHLSWTI